MTSIGDYLILFSLNQDSCTMKRQYQVRSRHFMRTYPVKLFFKRIENRCYFKMSAKHFSEWLNRSFIHLPKYIHRKSIGGGESGRLKLPRKLRNSAN